MRRGRQPAQLQSIWSLEYLCQNTCRVRSNAGFGHGQAFRAVASIGASMRYTLVTFLACPGVSVIWPLSCEGTCSGDAAKGIPPSTRVAPEGAVVAPLGPQSVRTEIGALLGRYAARCSPWRAAILRLRLSRVCWSARPAHDGFRSMAALPELLPDHLRDRDRDGSILEDVCAGAAVRSGRRIEGLSNCGRLDAKTEVRRTSAPRSGSARRLTMRIFSRRDIRRRSTCTTPNSPCT